MIVLKVKLPVTVLYIRNNVAILYSGFAISMRDMTKNAYVPKSPPKQVN